MSEDSGHHVTMVNDAELYALQAKTGQKVRIPLREMITRTSLKAQTRPLLIAAATDKPSSLLALMGPVNTHSPQEKNKENLPCTISSYSTF